MFNIDAQRAQELARDLSTPQGRYEVGQTMYEPFKEGRDYVSIGRKIFAVDYVQPGAPMWYDKDPQFSAVTLATLGGSPRVEVKGTRVELNPFPISVLVRIPAIEVAVRRFNILDREQVRARAEMAEREDVEIFKVIKTAAAASAGKATADVPGVASVATGAFTKIGAAELFSNVEDNDTPVENVIMRAKDYRDIRSGTNGWVGTEFDPVTRYELLKTGYMGDLWGAAIRISKKQTLGDVFACGSPEFLGVISVRIDLDQIDAPLGELLQFGWVFYEYIGIAQLTNVGSGLMQITRS
jgi:hypothetical protein